MVGNPPWVAYRHMSPDLQTRFKELAKGEMVYVGGKLATQNDLCALFTVRATMLYLRSGGRLGLVLPMAVLTRGQFDRLRRGSFHTSRIGWDAAWVMNDDVQPLFPVPSCAVFGRRTATSRPLPEKVRVYSGTLPLRDAPEEIADRLLKVTEGAPALETARVSKAARPTESCFARRDAVPANVRVCRTQANGPSRRRPQRPLCREPAQQSGEKALEGFAGHRESRRGGVLASGAAWREHLALSDFQAVRGRRSRNRKGRDAGCGNCS